MKLYMGGSRFAVFIMENVLRCKAIEFDGSEADARLLLSIPGKLNQTPARSYNWAVLGQRIGGEPRDAENAVKFLRDHYEQLTNPEIASRAQQIEEAANGRSL